MPHVPPIVHAEHLEGVAYLLGWERLPAADGGGWGARIGWVEMRDGGAWVLKGGTVPADQVGRINGQDYSKVPRDPRPRDPSDPRSPHSDRKFRASDDAYFDRMMQGPEAEAHRERMRRMDGNF